MVSTSQPKMTDGGVIYNNSGLRGIVEMLSTEQQVTFRKEHLQEVANLKNDDGIWMDVNVLYTQEKNLSFNSLLSCAQRIAGRFAGEFSRPLRVVNWQANLNETPVSPHNATNPHPPHPNDQLDEPSTLDLCRT